MKAHQFIVINENMQDLSEYERTSSDQYKDRTRDTADF